jgi:hypothetical protein
MMDATRPNEDAKDWHEEAFDLTRGIAAYHASPLIKGIARVIAKHPEAAIGNAFNHKQVACKVWARDRLFDVAGGRHDRVVIVGGWYGTLAGMLLEDPRFSIGAIESIDIDPAVGEVALTLNAHEPDRFAARTQDMYAVDYAGLGADLVINTSCEHIADLRGWLRLVPAGTRMLLQSNDYFAEPTHVSSVPSVEEFAAVAGLATVEFTGSLPQKKYTRFMLIGRV